MTLRTLALPVKVLFTCILLTIGTGYFFALTYLFLVDVQPHQKEGQNMIEGVMEKYYGRREMTSLESSLRGGMGDQVTDTEKAKLIAWIQAGASEDTFPDVQPIIENSCVGCHNHDDMPGAPLTNFAEVSAYTQTDTGTSAKTLVRVSHIHVFGMTFIFAIVSGIFVQSEARSGWRAMLVAIPFLAIWIDIGSWWFTKMNPVFAYTVIIGGGLAGLSLAIQIFLSLYELWLLPPVPPYGYGGPYQQPAYGPATVPVMPPPAMQPPPGPQPRRAPEAAGPQAGASGNGPVGEQKSGGDVAQPRATEGENTPRRD